MRPCRAQQAKVQVKVGGEPSSPPEVLQVQLVGHVGILAHRDGNHFGVRHPLCQPLRRPLADLLAGDRKLQIVEQGLDAAEFRHKAFVIQRRGRDLDLVVEQRVAGAAVGRSLFG